MTDEYGEVLLSRIRARVFERNNSFQLLVIGATGTGKSYSALMLAEALDANFNINRVCFTADSFLSLVNSDLPAGSAILADEVGLYMDNRNWMTLQNKLLTMVIETFRFQQLIVIWTVPSARMVDLNLRSLVHAQLETVDISFRKKKCETKFKHITTNPQTGAMYTNFPVIEGVGGQVTIERVHFGLPTAKLRKAYEIKKRATLKEKYKNIHKEISAMENGESMKKTGRRVEAKCNRCGRTIMTRSAEPQCRHCHTRDVEIL